MRTPLLIAALLLLFGGRFACGVMILAKPKGKTTLFAVSADPKVPLKLNDNICLVKRTYAKTPPTSESERKSTVKNSKAPTRLEPEKVEQGCGQVVRVTLKGVIVDLAKIDGILSPGNTVEIVKANRNFASEESALPFLQLRRDYLEHERALLFGMNLFSPYVRYDQAVSNEITMGLMPTYFTKVSGGNGYLNGIGAFATMSWYPESAFSGPHAMLAAGAFWLTAHTDPGPEKAFFTPVGLARLGYHFKWKSGISFAATGGVQYFYIPRTVSLIGYNFVGISPTGCLELGIAF